MVDSLATVSDGSDFLRLVTSGGGSLLSQSSTVGISTIVDSGSSWPSVNDTRALVLGAAGAAGTAEAEKRKY